MLTGTAVPSLEPERPCVPILNTGATKNPIEPPPRLPCSFDTKNGAQKPASPERPRVGGEMHVFFAPQYPLFTGNVNFSASEIASILPSTENLIPGRSRLRRQSS